MADKLQALSGMNTRTKLTIAVMVVVVLIILWQVRGMMGGGQPAAPAVPRPVPGAASSPGMTQPGPQSQMMTPKLVDVMKQENAQPATPQEMELMRIQQETQARYLQALNELQLLKVAKEIAVANKDISAAKLTRVLAEKKIVDTLAPPSPPQSVDARAAAPILPVQTTLTSTDQEAVYSVVSISQLQNQWSAVINYKGSLYNVHVGDVLPPDGSTISAIRKDGIILEKEGKKRKVSLVAAI